MSSELGSNSGRKRIDRVRAPRVHLTYDVETNGAIEERELPFEVLILADLSGQTEQLTTPFRDRKLLRIDLDSFDEVLDRCAPRLVFEVPNRLNVDPPKLNVELRFRCLDDFSPEKVARQIDPLRGLLEERSELISRLVDAGGDDRVDDREIASLRASVTNIEELLSAQLNEIMHSPPFQRLEATWRGLHFLATQTETGPSLELHVLDVTKRELSRDLTQAASFDQSALFKHVYEQEFGTFGGRAFGVLIGDYEIGSVPNDIHLLGQISHIAAAAHAPFVAAAAPTFFGMDSFGEIGKPRALAHIFDNVEYAQWRSFRESEDARYVALVLPRILLRRPFGESNPAEAFDFREHTDRHDEWLWGNAAYALGACITNAFAKYHWCAAIKGIEGGGLVEGLPTGTFMTEYGETAAKCPVEIALSDRREVELAHLGFIPLIPVKGTDHAVFFSMQTCAKPRTYEFAWADANARLSTQLQYVLTTSRFAHYLKQVVRNRLGSFHPRAVVQNYLNNWLSRYVTTGGALSIADKANFPLLEAHVDVSEVPGKPGVYRAVAFLRPDFQLEELSVSMRIMLELARP